MSRKAHFHSVNCMFRANVQNADPVQRSTVRLGTECGVPYDAAGPASEVFPRRSSTDSGSGAYDERLHLELGTRS